MFPRAHFAQERYAIDVHGPNGFFREFSGDPKEPGVAVRLAYECHGSQLSGNVQVLLNNHGKHQLRVAVQDNSYGSGTVYRVVAGSQQSEVLIPLQQSHGWYDVTVQAAGSETKARFAGRVETGRSSFSDPVMGAV